MNRILSVESSRGCAGDSSFITKRLCISVLFSVGFLCFLGGYLFGRLSTESASAVRTNASKASKAELEKLGASIGRLTARASARGAGELPAEPLERFRRLLACDRLDRLANDTTPLDAFARRTISSKLTLFAECLDEAFALLAD